MRFWHLICIAVAIMLLGGERASADSFAPPQDSFLISQDQRYILVRLLTDEDIARFPDVKIDQELRATYPRSGLYTNDDEWRLLWEYHGSLWSEFISADGVYMFGIEGLPYNPDQVVITFYKHGEPFRKYMLGELINPRAALRTAGGGYLWIADRSFDGATNQITLRTEDGRRYTFDLTTGEMLSRSSAIPGFLLIGGISAALVLAGAALVVRRRKLPVYD